MHKPGGRRRRWRLQPRGPGQTESACHRRAGGGLAGQWGPWARLGCRDTYVKLLGGLAQGGVVLLDKVPANLILGKIAVARCGTGGLGGGRGGRVRVGGALVLLLVGKVTVRRHGFPLHRV